MLWTKPKVGKYHAALLRTGDDKLLMLDDGGDLCCSTRPEGVQGVGPEQGLRRDVGAPGPGGRPALSARRRRN